MDCPFCGKKMVNEKCSDCSYSNASNVVVGEAITEDVQTKEKVNLDKNEEENKFTGIYGHGSSGYSATAFKIVLCILTIFISPVIGAIMGVILKRKPKFGLVDFGHKLLMFAVAIVILEAALGLVATFLF